MATYFSLNNENRKSFEGIWYLEKVLEKRKIFFIYLPYNLLGYAEPTLKNPQASSLKFVLFSLCFHFFWTTEHKTREASKRKKTAHLMKSAQPNQTLNRQIIVWFKLHFFKLQGTGKGIFKNNSMYNVCISNWVYDSWEFFLRCAFFKGFPNDYYKELKSYLSSSHCGGGISGPCNQTALLYLSYLVVAHRHSWSENIQIQMF